MNAPKKLTEAHYSKWRLGLEKLEHSKTKASVAKLKCDVLELQIEILKGRLALTKNGLETAGHAVESEKAAYLTTLEAVEADAGFTIKGCAVSDATFEVTPLETNTETKDE